MLRFLPQGIITAGGIVTSRPAYRAEFETRHKQGWSLIPVWGDLITADASKQPSIRAWQPFQERRASLRDFDAWRDIVGGLAVIGGKVSGGLLILDCDDFAAAERLETTAPDLAATYKETSPKGIHYFYNVESGVSLQSRARLGGHKVDLLGEGKYCLIAPTSGYDAINDVKPRKLSQSDYLRLVAIFDPTITATIAFKQAEANNRDSKVDATADRLLKSAFVHPSERLLPLPAITTIYSTQSQAIGRNNALFNALRLGRDVGYDKDELFRALEQQHISAPAPAGHGKQSPQARLKEYHRTVKSVFSRPPQPRNGTVYGQLTDAAREKLLQADMTATARTVDALLMKGLAGKSLSRKEIFAACAGLVGVHSVRAALKAAFNGRAIFALSPHAPTPKNYVESDSSINAYRGMQIPTQIRRGRKAALFIVPTSAQIQAITGCTHKASTALQPADVRSVKPYRSGLQYGFIHRKPRQLPLGWMAGRLGRKSKNTIRHYHKQRGIESIQRFKTEALLTKDNLDGTIGGVFFSDAYFIRAGGADYPVKHQLAQYLVRRYKDVRLMRQLPSLYSSKPFKNEAAANKFQADLNHLRSLQGDKKHLGINRTSGGKETDFSAYWNDFYKQPDPAPANPTDKQPDDIELRWDDAVAAMEAAHDALPAPGTQSKRQFISRWSRYLKATRLAADLIFEMEAGYAPDYTEGTRPPRQLKGYSHEEHEAAAYATRFIKGLSHHTALKLAKTYGCQRLREMAQSVMLRHQLIGKIKNPAAVLVHELRSGKELKTSSPTDAKEHAQVAQKAAQNTRTKTRQKQIELGLGNMWDSD